MAFKEHGDERGKIPLSNITILAGVSTLSAFKECLGRINLHKHMRHKLIQVVKIAIVPSRVDLLSKPLFTANANKTFQTKTKQKNHPKFVKGSDQETSK